MTGEPQELPPNPLAVRWAAEAGMTLEEWLEQERRELDAEAVRTEHEIDDAGQA